MITDFERAVLVKLCQETTMARAAHPPEHVLVHRFPNLGHRVRKALNKLVSKGYVARASNQKCRGCLAPHIRAGDRQEYRDSLRPGERGAQHLQKVAITVFFYSHTGCQPGPR